MGSLGRLLVLALVVAGLFYFAQEKGWLKGEGKAPSCVPQEPKKAAAPPPGPMESAFWTVRESVALRSGAGASFGSVAELPEGAVLKELARQPGWVYVQTDQGQKGWVNAGNLQRAKARLPR